DELLGGLRAAEEGRHLGGVRPLELGQVIGSPRHEGHIHLGSFRAAIVAALSGPHNRLVRRGPMVLDESSNTLQGCLWKSYRRREPLPPSIPTKDAPWPTPPSVPPSPPPVSARRPAALPPQRTLRPRHPNPVSTSIRSPTCFWAPGRTPGAKPAR